MHRAIAATSVLIFAPCSLAAQYDAVDQCTEMHKIAPSTFLCFMGSSGHTYDQVKRYERSELTPLANGLYKTMGIGPLFLVSEGKAMVSDSNSYLNDERMITFFNNEGDQHLAYFCQYPSPITQPIAAERSAVLGYAAGNCEPVPDGDYEAKGGLRYTIIDGAPYDYRDAEPMEATCFHGWEAGKEVLHCEDRH